MTARAALLTTIVGLALTPPAGAAVGAMETYASPIAGIAPAQTPTRRSIRTLRAAAVRAASSTAEVKRFTLVATAGNIKLRGGATVPGYRFKRE